MSDVATINVPEAKPIREPVYRAIGRGILEPMFKIEGWYNKFAKSLIYVSAVVITLMVIPICLDIITRSFFGFSIDGIVEIETFALIPIAFVGAGYITASRQHVQIDILFDRFSSKTKLRLLFMANTFAFLISLVLVWQTFEAAMDTEELSSGLYLPIRFFILITTFGFVLTSIGFFFQLCHVTRDLVHNRDFKGMAVVICFIICLISTPFIYKAVGYKISGLAIGGIGFLILFSLLLLRVPICFGMATMGLLGLLCLSRSPWAALATIGDIPYMEAANFVLVAIPMFMFMGELAFHSGLSNDLFECANRWFGRLPGGLAVATVGGCAGFGAVCGESLPTVITMSAVAMPAMRERNYHPGLSTGVLAAGGTLGILIPPSIGFIFYSIITEESIGKLFIAGIFPGILLASLFMCCIVIQVKRNPSLAPRGDHYTMKEKLASLIYLLPMAGLFGLVVGGILAGSFTPGEGGAVGAMGAFLYAVARRRMNFTNYKSAVVATATLSAKLFIIFSGVYIFGAFLASSRLPNLLADTIVELEINRYAVLMIVVVLYMFLGCVMNIIPMMMITLPSIFPTIMALGFDGIWFGVVTVILMEMGMITPPIGMNVFTISSLHPDIPMATTFKGVLPFFLCMFTCVLILIAFPSIALFLPNTLM